MIHTLGRVMQELRADFRELRRNGPVRPKPEKGLRRSLLCISWLALHAFEAVWLVLYGAFTQGPGLAAVWLLATATAGILYLFVVFSDPGFMSAAAVQQLVDEHGLQVCVTAPDAVSAGACGASSIEDDAPHAPSAEPGGSAAATAAAAAAGAAGATAGLELSAVDIRAVYISAVGVSGAAAGATEAEEIAPVQAVAAGHVPVGAGKAKMGGGAASNGASAVVRELEVVEGDGGDGAAEPALSERYVWQGGTRLLLRPDENAPPPLSGPAHTYFSHYSEKAGMLIPIRAKYCKKHGKLIAKFDHYCYALGNSVGELNHGLFWRLLFCQVLSIWLGKWLVDHAFLHVHTHSDVATRWVISNLPLLTLDLLAYLIGIPLSLLLLIHSYLGLTSSTTHEFVKFDKLEYLKGFYEFTCPFSEGLCANLRRFCCPKKLSLWERPPPEAEWPETCWRNRYYACLG